MNNIKIDCVLDAKANLGEGAIWSVKDQMLYWVDINEGLLCKYNPDNGKNIAIDFKKPISCHLYPVRVQDYSEFAAVNYHKWPICNDACTLGASLKVPVYKFVKEALIRKFGEYWYAELEKVAKKV